MQNRFLLTIFIIILLSPTVSHAKIRDLRPSGPLKIRTQHPLYLQFLAMPMESPQTLNKDQFELQIQTTFSNIFEYSPFNTTFVNFDMEIWRTALTFGYGLTEQLDVRVEIPFLSNGGGFLDGFINWYHSVFNAPTGGRELVGNNQFSYRLTQGGTTLINHSPAIIGLSDIIIRFKYLLSDHWNLPFKVAIASYIKLPTGQTSKGFSSGHIEPGFSLFFEKSLKRFHFATQVGYVFLTGHANLDSIMSQGFFQFGQSLEFQLWNGLSIITQITGNTSAFKNVDATDLTEIVLDLNVGVAGSFPLKHSFFDEFFYQWSFSEDILSSGPSVDFSILFLSGVRF